MKRLLILFLGLILSISLTENTQAQLLRRLKDKATQKVAERVEQRVDQKLQEIAYKQVDKTWDSVFGAPNPQGNQGGSPSDGDYDDEMPSYTLPFSLNSNVTTEDLYSFSSESVMEIISSDNDSDGPVLMKVYTNENGDYSGTAYETEESRREDGLMFIVYDYKNQAMVMMSESEEGKFSFAYDWSTDVDDSVDFSQEELDEYYGKFESLGTKTILGYECEGYKTKDEGSEYEFWVSTEEIEGLEHSLSANSSTKYLRGNPMLSHPSGSILSWKGIDEDGETFEMTMIEINNRVNLSFDVSEYPVIGAN